jgi:hypothetical protein
MMVPESLIAKLGQDLRGDVESALSLSLSLSLSLF